MKTIFSLTIASLLMSSCSVSKEETRSSSSLIPVLFDTDANNELDDQHALAYLLFNGNTFNVKGVTVNATFNGGNIEKHYQEAERIIKLAKAEGKVPLRSGADGNFEEIQENINQENFDGSEAVNFIVKQAQDTPDKLVVIAVGKLTNVALAVAKDPSIKEKIRLVWLGANYPEPGEYNLVNDTAAMNYLLNTNIPFEMVTVRYGKPSGTDAVRATREEVNRRMPGLGPKIDKPVSGRHGEAFSTFGDYSVNLFEHIDYHGDPPSRALFDMVAVAIVKNPQWGETKEIPAPIYIEGQWKERPDNDRTITIWENFKIDALLEDFYQSMENYVLVE